MALYCFSAVFLMLSAAKRAENREACRCDVGHTFAAPTDPRKNRDFPLKKEGFRGFRRLTWS
jgi:hypothetical protein